MFDPNRPFAIRADANEQVGSGHMMRCLSIAENICALGFDVVFLVSDEGSSSLPVDRGFKTTVLSSRCTRWDGRDGSALGALVSKSVATGLLIDSYAVTDSFFSGFRGSCGQVPVGYIDDLYTFELGRMDLPVRREVDLVFNYGFHKYEQEYSQTYSGSVTRLCLGLEYAPVRACFAQGSFVVKKTTKRVLITTGGSVPNVGVRRHRLRTVTRTS